MKIYLYFQNILVIYKNNQMMKSSLSQTHIFFDQQFLIAQIDIEFKWKSREDGLGYRSRVPN